MPICENCRASVPRLRETSDGKRVCCPACVYNPLGCRCKYGQLGVAEWRDYSDPAADPPWGEYEAEALEDASADCHKSRSGDCPAAGSEYCDFECPFR